MILGSDGEKMSKTNPKPKPNPNPKPKPNPNPTLARHSYEDIITAAGVTGASGSAEDRYKIRRGAMLDC